MVMADEFTVGVEALERGDWLSACQAFEAALQRGQTAEALDGLGQARWWLNDLERAIELRSRAYACYLESDRPAPGGPHRGLVGARVFHRARQSACGGRLDKPRRVAA